MNIHKPVPKRIIIAFLLLSLIISVENSNSEDNATLFKKGIVPYGANYLPEPLKSRVVRWIAEHFDWSVGGPDVTGYNSNVVWTTYQTIIGTYSNEIPRIKDYAEAHGWSFEDMLLHMKINFQAKKPWNMMDKFGCLEGKNGVLVKYRGLLGDRIVDRTKEAYDINLGNVEFGNELYIGYEEPFDEINFLLSTEGKDVEARWEYWNGTSWSNLDVDDGTKVFKKNGTVRFIPPADWERTVINNSRNKWWVRLCIQGAGTYPVASRIFGDDWHASSTNNLLCKGWDPNSPNIINRGTPVEYNPNPPENAGARFRYQSRATGYWGPNYIFYNPANIQGGIRTVAKYVADKAIPAIKKSNAKALMFDTADGTLSVGITTPSQAAKNSDFVDQTSDTWKSVSKARYSDVHKFIKEALPNTLIGANASPYLKDFVSLGDWVLYEYHTFVRQSSSPRRILLEDGAKESFASYDHFLKENNPRGIKGFFIYNDTVDYDTKRNFHWDRSNRGPMVALTKHYIGMNENTYFVYYTQGGYIYAFSDEVFYYKAEAVLQRPLKIYLPNNLKYIYGDDFSQLVSIPYFGMRVKIGDDILYVKKVDNKTLTTESPIRKDYGIGEKIKVIGMIHQSVDPLPPLSDIYKWSYYFPAMDVDIGMPDVSGHNKGKYDLMWVKGKDIGGGPDVWKRDFINAIVLHRTAFHGTPAIYYETYSTPIKLNKVYFPLMADGTTAPGIEEVCLRAGEGVILMKYPVEGK
ncbi:MAG: hypothetical protein RDU59_04180 [Thermodesulfobacteriota bacterium]|nr:hypothetical protein [Thermodesulfobacteriota bacterium]